MNALEKQSHKIIVIESNNDLGYDKIRSVYAEFRTSPLFHFFPSMRFEYFLVLLQHAQFIIGNSSAGIREAPHFGVAAINLGSRQNNRARSKLIINAEITPDSILEAIGQVPALPKKRERNFGDGQSVVRFIRILEEDKGWEKNTQKQFVDRSVTTRNESK
jgi:UDP-N-acetylglucosamine 2-epimerase (hydrolysing)